MLNQVTLIGNVGQDPEVRYGGNGNAITNVSLATNEGYKDKEGNKVDKTSWHRLVFFGKLAEIVGEYVRKGSQIAVVGKIDYNKWTDKEGVEKYTTQIICDTMKMIGKNPNAGQGEGSGQKKERYDQKEERRQEKAAPAGKGAQQGFDEDIPFN